MRHSFLIAIALSTLLISCKQEAHHTGANPGPPELQLDARPNPELEYENLRLYPITAAPAYMERHAAAARYQNLKEAIGNHRFRITEKKPFGRFQDQSAVSTLTVQNKSENAVFLMAGDVVQGGKQDRVIAQDLMVPPRTITDIAVLCVEPHRWQAQGEEGQDDAPQPAKNKPIYAFTGYYNVAAGNIRRSVIHGQGQQRVWEEVGKLTALYNAQTPTGAYAALEQSGAFTQNRGHYLEFFEDKFEDTEQVVGIVAVSGNEVIGADVFAHPSLFRKQYKALIHSYITDAITNGQAVEIKEADIRRYEKKLWQNFQQDKAGMKYEFDGLMVHFTGL